MIEKLLPDRTGEKGARDLRVVARLLATAGPADLDERLRCSSDFWRATLDRPCSAPRRLPSILSVDEVTQLIDPAHIRQRIVRVDRDRTLKILN